jgi:hypothetical protein
MPSTVVQVVSAEWGIGPGAHFIGPRWEASATDGLAAHDITTDERVMAGRCLQIHQIEPPRSQPIRMSIIFLLWNG